MGASHVAIKSDSCNYSIAMESNFSVTVGLVVGHANQTKTTENSFVKRLVGARSMHFGMPRCE